MSEQWVTHNHPPTNPHADELARRLRALDLSESTLMLMIANRAAADRIERQVREIERRAEDYYSLRDNY